MLQRKILLITALTLTPAIVVLAGAQSANIHSFYVITERGNSFPIEPPPPPLPPGFDISPYLERHDSDGLVTIMYSPNAADPYGVYEVRELGSQVDLPDEAGRGSAVVSLVNQEHWDDGIDLGELPPTPLAGNFYIRQYDVGGFIAYKLVAGLMANDPVSITSTDIFAVADDHCDGTRTSRCVHLSATDGFSFLNSSSDSLGRTYLDLPPTGVTHIEFDAVPIGVNFICPDCDATDPNDIRAYAGMSSTTIEKDVIGASPNAYGSYNYHQIIPSAPPLLLHPNLQDVSFIMDNSYFTLSFINVTSATDGMGCNFPGHDLNITPGGILLAIPSYTVSFTDPSCGAVTNMAYDRMVETLNMRDWLPIYPGYNYLPVTQGNSFHHGTIGWQNVITVHDPGYGAKLQLMEDIDPAEYEGPCCPGFDPTLKMSINAFGLDDSALVIYSKDVHLMLLGDGIVVNPDVSDALKMLQYIQWTGSPTLAAGPDAIAHQSDYSTSPYNGLNWEPDGATPTAPYRMRMVEGASIDMLDKGGRGEIYDIRNNKLLVRGTSDSEPIIDPDVAVDVLNKIIDDGLAPALFQNWNYIKNRDGYTFADMHMSNAAVDLVTSLKYIAGYNPLGTSATRSYVGDPKPHDDYLSVPVKDNVLRIQDVYVVVPFQQTTAVRDVYLSKYPCGAIGDQQFDEYMDWLQVHDNAFRNILQIMGGIHSSTPEEYQSDKLVKPLVNTRANTPLPYLDGTYDPGETMSVPVLPNRPYLCMKIDSSNLSTIIDVYTLRFAGDGFSVGSMQHLDITTHTGSVHPATEYLLGSATEFDTIYETVVQAPNDGPVSIDMLANMGMIFSGLAIVESNPGQTANQWRDTGTVTGNFRGVIETNGVERYFDLGEVKLDLASGASALPLNAGPFSPHVTSFPLTINANADETVTTSVSEPGDVSSLTLTIIWDDDMFFRICYVPGMPPHDGGTDIILTPPGGAPITIPRDCDNGPSAGNVGGIPVYAKTYTLTGFSGQPLSGTWDVNFVENGGHVANAGVYDVQLEFTRTVYVPPPGAPEIDTGSMEPLTDPLNPGSILSGICAYRFSLTPADSNTFTSASSSVSMKAGETVKIKLQANVEIGGTINDFCGRTEYVERLYTTINVGTFRVDLY